MGDVLFLSLEWATSFRPEQDFASDVSPSSAISARRSQRKINGCTRHQLF
jgi:hypothetical protein